MHKNIYKARQNTSLKYLKYKILSILVLEIQNTKYKNYISKLSTIYLKCVQL